MLIQYYGKIIYSINGILHSMKKLLRFWKVLVIDILGVTFMILAVLTGWLPGPGGIPLFIVGLSLLAINHEWAERYIDILKKYADRLGDLIFVKNPRVQFLYDVMAPFAVVAGVILLSKHSAVWMISLGIFLSFIGITFLLGNRGRWGRLKRKLKQNN